MRLQPVSNLNTYFNPSDVTAFKKPMPERPEDTQGLNISQPNKVTKTTTTDTSTTDIQHVARGRQMKDSVRDLLRYSPVKHSRVNTVTNAHLHRIPISNIPFSTTHAEHHKNDISIKEKELTSFSQERDELQRAIFKIPTHPRSVAERRKKQRTEARIDVVEHRISQLRMYIKRHAIRF